MKLRNQSCQLILGHYRVSLEHWTVGQLNNVFLKYRAMELSGHSKIATPIGNLLRKNDENYYLLVIIIYMYYL